MTFEPLLYVLIALCALQLAYLFWRKPAWTGFRDKTVWDWVSLLLVPTTVGFGTFLISAAQVRTEAERQQEVAVQQYIDRISTLSLQQTDDNEQSILAVARAQTAAVFQMVSGKRTGRILVFLNEMGWLNALVDDLENLDFSNADLKSFDLSGMEFEGADLSGADLEDSVFLNAEFEDADLTGADLDGAILRGAEFVGASMKGAELAGADLRGADLSGAYGLSARMLRDSCMDETTKLPRGLVKPTGKTEACDKDADWETDD